MKIKKNTTKKAHSAWNIVKKGLSVENAMRYAPCAMRLLVVLSICNITCAQEESKMSFSLEEALNYAVKNNHTIKNAALDAGISKSKVKEVTAMGYLN